MTGYAQGNRRRTDAQGTVLEMLMMMVQGSLQSVKIYATFIGTYFGLVYVLKFRIFYFFIFVFIILAIILFSYVLNKLVLLYTLFMTACYGIMLANFKIQMCKFCIDFNHNKNRCFKF